MYEYEKYHINANGSEEYVKSVNKEYKNKTGHNPVFYLPIIRI